MKIDEQICHFLFHPLALEHSVLKQFLATITVIALSILTAGTFLIAFVVINWRDRNITVEKKPTIEARVAQKVILPNPKPTVSASGPKPTTKAEVVKQKQAWQLNQFEEWAATNQWGKIHSAHYDWWMFPVNYLSRQKGSTYQVSQSDVEQLKRDPEFMKNYRRGVELEARAWGWEVYDKKPVENPTSDQKWQNWSVRLGKMADSLRLFKEDGLFESMKQYAAHAKLNIYNFQPSPT